MTAARPRTPTPPITCNRCDATWTALGAMHCAGCHRTFSGIALFDRHRTQVGERGTCLDPDQIRHRDTGARVMFFRDGMWRGPEMDEETKAQRFGAA